MHPDFFVSGLRPVRLKGSPKESLWTFGGFSPGCEDKFTKSDQRPDQRLQDMKNETREEIRINRYISMAGIASRRKADELVVGGKVKVNGEVMTDLGYKVDPRHDRVSVDGKPVMPVQRHLYLVMNKPKDTITTVSDEKGRTTVMSLITSSERVYPVGRLDRNTTGVLLFTNDGEFANHLMHPKYEVPKSYLVTCTERVKPVHLDKLARGMDLDDGKTTPAEIVVMQGAKGKEIGVTIYEGRNRQVRRMFEALGYEVKKLDRVAYGPVTKEGLGRGETRSLTKPEVRKLMQMAGMDPLFETDKPTRKTSGPPSRPGKRRQPHRERPGERRGGANPKARPMKTRRKPRP